MARTSHLPHLLAVLTAGQLAEAQPEHLSLSGQGVRDVTRIAAGDPDMWTQILRANQAAVGEILRDVQTDLARLVDVLANGDPAMLAEILTRGVAGTRVIPGKHGGPALATASVFVSVPDHPGELARLFADVGEIGVNIEDLYIDHDPGRPVGLVELVVQGHCRRVAAGGARGQGLAHPPVRLALAVAPPGESREREFSAVSSNAVSRVVVAMDGPSGSGKSSTARGVATRLGLRYLDTGAQFRAVTAWMLERGVDFEDPAAIADLSDEPELVSGTDPEDPTITVDGKDVAVAIRSQEVTTHVSAVASVPEVRRRLLRLQRMIIGEGGIVVEGRDIGSVVAPDAEVKVFLTADPSARAARRTKEVGAGDVDATQADLLRRDKIDSGRTASPLTMAEGAIHLDTTPYTLDEVVQQVVDIVDEAVGAKADRTSGPKSGSAG